MSRRTTAVLAALISWMLPYLSMTPVKGAVVHDMWPAQPDRLQWTADDHPSRDPGIPSEDKEFGRKRWPCIIRGAAWSRRQESTPLPPSARELMPILKETFASQGLPSALAWVAEVESMWITNAVSKSGARGLYQFKTEAARRFALLRDAGDFRDHPEQSARAAARYLAQLYAQLGDWRLAVAAYNAGDGYVARLMKSRRARIYDEIASELPPQTQIYVIKVMTVLSLRENTTLSALPAPAITPSGN